MVQRVGRVDNKACRRPRDGRGRSGWKRFRFRRFLGNRCAMCITSLSGFY